MEIVDASDLQVSSPAPPQMMIKHTPEEFFALLRKRIASKDYNALFSAGCCFEFALQSHRRGIGTLANMKGALNPAKKGHVFVITPDGRAFDRRGFREIAAVIKEFGEWGDEPRFAATEAEIETDAKARNLPPELAAEIFAIADQLITTLVSSSG